MKNMDLFQLFSRKCSIIKRELENIITIQNTSSKVSGKLIALLLDLEDLQILNSKKNLQGCNKDIDEELDFIVSKFQKRILEQKCVAEIPKFFFGTKTKNDSFFSEMLEIVLADKKGQFIWETIYKTSLRTTKLPCNNPLNVLKKLFDGLSRTNFNPLRSERILQGKNLVDVYGDKADVMLAEYLINVCSKQAGKKELKFDPCLTKNIFSMYSISEACFFEGFTNLLRRKEFNINTHSDFLLKMDEVVLDIAREKKGDEEMQRVFEKWKRERICLAKKEVLKTVDEDMLNEEGESIKNYPSELF